jgi:hypothetical protein
VKRMRRQCELGAASDRQDIGDRKGPITPAAGGVDSKRARLLALSSVRREKQPDQAAVINQGSQNRNDGECHHELVELLHPL